MRAERSRQCVRVWLLLQVFFGAILASAAHGQSAIPVFTSLRSSATSLVSSLPNDAILRQLNERIAVLAELYAQPGVNVAPEYLRSLEVDAELLNKSRLVSREEKRAIVADVAADISVKFEFAMSSPQLGGRPPTTVEVVVTTTKSNNPVDGYQIGWNKFRYSSPLPLFTFDKPTSPSEGRLAPGRYIILVIKSGQVVKSEPRQIGLGGQRRIEIVQPVD